jgi:hypothetical protein
MSVIVTFRVKTDPKELERRAAEHSDVLRGLAERAKERGVIAHRFYGSDDEIMMIDEWPDEDSFLRFFADHREEIEPMMRTVASGDPEIAFWHKLATHDEIGWGR